MAPKLFVASGIFPPELGGPATYLAAVLPALLALGWEPRVLTYGPPHSQDSPYPVTRIARAPYPLRMTRYAFEARKHLAWADLVYAHTIDLPLWGFRDRPRVIKIVGDQAWERCIRRRWIPSDLSIDEFQTYDGDWRARWQKRSRSAQVAAMNAVIVPSQYLARMVTAWGVEPTKVHVIYNALPPAPPPAQTREALRAQLQWDDRPTLITVARLQPWKGIDHLIAVMRRLPNARLVVVGDGPDRARLQSLAEPLGDRVKFTGRLKPAQVHRLMRAADGLALYSGYEGLSHTLLESLRLGTPVLASAVGGNPEIVRDGVNGLLVPYVDVAALQRGIAELIDRRAEFAANSQAGLGRFRLETMARKTDQLLRSLLP
ncbi:MAG: glycosyltransferase family 4 protein [Chloroflexota bacterium]|nr:glycosyltransferase family 4 protein [Chloroflexota bacterium]MDE2948634.1 glycosyltransferase family 4 protein [Chloroflexota bacterium]